MIYEWNELMIHERMKAMNESFIYEWFMNEKNESFMNEMNEWMIHEWNE